jgi:hypothetical protein
VKKYYIIACHVLWREMCHCAAVSPNVHDLHFLEQGLHNTPDQLRTALQQAIDAVPPEWEAVLVGYGLCSRGIEGIQARGVPVVFPRGHDCITLLLGSKERYQDYFDTHPGTYWYSPGWIDTHTQPGRERYEKLMAEYTALYGAENAEYLFQAGEGWMQSYDRATYVGFAEVESDQYTAYTRRCAEWLGWAFEHVHGDAALVRDLLAGNWDSERFLVIKPGERVVASYDEGIIKADRSCGTNCPGCGEEKA